jgi:hypothetical protein
LSKGKTLPPSSSTIAIKNDITAATLTQITSEKQKKARESPGSEFRPFATSFSKAMDRSSSYLSKGGDGNQLEVILFLGKKGAGCFRAS